MKLERNVIEEKLTQLPQWQLKDGEDAIVREITTADFVSALEVVNTVGQKAEEMNHHPDIQFSYGNVTITLSTHSEGGVTEKDIELAKEIDGLV